MNASANTAIKSGDVRSFSFIFASEDLPDSVRSVFEHLGLKVIGLPAFRRLDPPVAKHADMLLFPTADGLLISSEYYQANKPLFSDVRVIVTEEMFAPAYPHDILLNALDTDVGILCKADSVSARIKELGKPIIPVAQGYTRCSVCKVNDRAIITADPSIALAAKDHGLDVLQICSGQILLPGYSNGFIGGCSVRIGNKMLFTGTIEEHPDFESIDAFLGIYGVTPVSICDGPLTDYGGFVLI